VRVGEATSSILALGMLLAAGAAVTALARTSRESQCVQFRSPGRLIANTPFTVALPRGLWLRLLPQGQQGWLLNVNPPDGAVDYIWPVSPPFRTAPHLFIGPAYGTSAAESVRLHRELRFVLSDTGYRVAADAAEGSDPKDVETAIARYGKGRLRVTITGFAMSPTGDARTGRYDRLRWVTFTGEACVPQRAGEE
jgi:hypothetical protein